MKRLLVFLVLFALQNEFLIIAAEQSPLAIEHALQERIKNGDYAYFLQQSEQLATLDAWNLETLLSCLDAHHRALVAERHMLNNEVSEQVAAIRTAIKERFDAQVATMKQVVSQCAQDRVDWNDAYYQVDYDCIANAFLCEELKKLAPRWSFWQRDCSREYALRTFSDLRNLTVGMSANNIHRRIEGLSKEEKERYIALEQQETDEASILVQKTLDTHFKKVYARYESVGEIENWHYERKRPGEEAEWQCTIV